MIGPFKFEEGGRTFTCHIEEPRAARADAWWWFGVSGDQHRYAPFTAAKGDTQDNVRTRVIAYYADLLARRAMPAEARGHWARRGKTAAPAPGTAPTTGAAPAGS